MDPINVNEYEALAQARLEPGAWDYHQGGSEDEVTLRANRTAFEHIRLRPRILAEETPISLQTTALGSRRRVSDCTGCGCCWYNNDCQHF